MRSNLRCAGVAGFALAVALALTSAGGARAHILEPRKGLEGFIRRADVIVLAKVAVATRPENLKVSELPLITDLEVEKVFRGENVPKTIAMLGRDDHAARYRKGQRVLVFLHGRPGIDAKLAADQLKGEELFVDPSEDSAWAAFLEACVRVHKTHPDLFSHPGYRAALFAAVGAPARRLREHALRRVSVWAADPKLGNAEVDALLAALRTRTLPDRYRVGLLSTGLAHFAIADLRALIDTADESIFVRGALLDGWADRARSRRAAPGELEAMRAAGVALLGASADVQLKLYAAAALARTGDATGLELLKTALTEPDLRRKRVAIRGLARLRAARHPEADSVLREAKRAEKDARVQGWLTEALPPGTAPPPAPGIPMLVWLGVALGGLVLVSLTLFAMLVVRRRKRAARA